MARIPAWEEELRRIAESSGLHTHRRSARILRGPARDGESVWEREEIHTADQDGNIYTFDQAWTTHAVCGCVLTKESGQIICSVPGCSGVICREHARECEYCHLWYCPRHIAVYGRGEDHVAYCRRHKFIHYLKLIGGLVK